MQEDNSDYWYIDIYQQESEDAIAYGLYRTIMPGHSTERKLRSVPFSAGTYYIEIRSADKWSSDEYGILVDFDTEPKI